MKNFKKIIAGAAALAMTMSMGVSVFADASATYEDGFVQLTDAPIDAVHQWTVVVISKANQNKANLEAADLYYINQGTTGESFWTDGLGTKVDLPDGTYIVRIGGETIDDPEDLIEIEFTVSSTPVGVSVQLGDVDDSGVVNGGDINPIIQHILGATTLTGKAFFVADTDSSGVVNGGDINPIIQHILGATELGTATYVAE